MTANRVSCPHDRAPVLHTMTEAPAWRISQIESRARYLAKFDAAGAADYHAVVGTLAEEDEAAYQADIAGLLPLVAGADVLDAGAGSGALTSVLTRLPGISITALEPSPAMLAILRSNPRLRGVATVEAFCDADADRPLFAAGRFDAIVSRQLANGLYDPLVAFRNWRHWLKPHGVVLVIEGTYGRDAWRASWVEEVDVLPLSACQTRATVPYLLEAAGLRVESVRWMGAVNERPATRTPRYAVLARNVAP
jgi:SAM-dependent methyltransferase